MSTLYDSSAASFFLLLMSLASSFSLAALALSVGVKQVAGGKVGQRLEDGAGRHRYHPADHHPAKNGDSVGVASCRSDINASVLSQFVSNKEQIPVQ